MLFWYLLKNPEVLKRVVAEMDANVPLKKEGGVYPHVGLDADSFLYTSACINEAFRMTPAVGMLMPRVVTDPLGQTIDGHVIPKEVSLANDPATWRSEKDHIKSDLFNRLIAACLQPLLPITLTYGVTITMSMTQTGSSKVRQDIIRTMLGFSCISGKETVNASAEILP